MFDLVQQVIISAICLYMLNDADDEPEQDISAFGSDVHVSKQNATVLSNTFAAT